MSRAVRSPEGKARHVAATMSRAQANQVYVNEIKSARGCSVCGDQYATFPYLLDFHHLDPREKRFTLAQVGSRSRISIDTEIEKCVVLCVVHHKMLHRGDVTVADFLDPLREG